MNNKRFYRSQKEKMIGGVCAGLADYFNIDPTVMRLIFVLLFLIGAHGLLLYLILWIITPLEAQNAGEAVINS